MNDKKLTQKEESFCRYMAMLGNGRESAQKAGYTVMPEYKAICLLARKSIKSRVQELKKESTADNSLVAAGLRRLAFGSTADAVKLILSCGDGSVQDIDGLDLFSVSEIKYTQNKGMEIKFFDRLKALERLAQMTEGNVNSVALSFYEAIERSAARMSEDADG